MLPIFSVVLLDMLGIGIVIPIVASLFVNPEFKILSAGADFSMRAVWLGVFLATYPLAQFFGAPILGALADRWGRKRVLIISLLGTVAGYLMFGAGIALHHLWLLLASRFIDGFTGGNISVAQSAIADMSETPQDKARNFGLVGMAFALGFMLGPFIGGFLSSPEYVSWFNFATPFWFAACLSAVNILLVSLAFRETIKEKIERPITWATGIRNVARAFSLPNLQVLFLVVFLLSFGFNFFTQFFGVFLLERFGFAQTDTGWLFAYIGLWIAISQGVIVRVVARHFLPQQALKFSVFLLACAFPILLITGQARMMYVVLPLIALLQGVTQPNVAALVSSMADAASQGEVLGIQQSIVSLSQIIPPVVSGVVAGFSVNLPIVFAAACIGLAWLIFVTKYRSAADSKFHEL